MLTKTNKIVSTVIFLFLIPLICFSQDSLPKKINFKIAAKLWARWDKNLNSKVSMPNYIKFKRQMYTRDIPNDFDEMTDNPLRHGATYIDIKTTTTYKTKVKLNVDLFAEQRGVSYGLFYKKNLLLYPVFNIEGNDSFNIFKKAFTFYGKLGMLLDEKLDEGLTIYNVDAQGFQLKIHRKKYTFSYTIYGDFYGGIGLNVDDIDALSITKKMGKNDNSFLGLSLNYNSKVLEGYRNNLLFNMFGHKNLNNAKAYFQIGYRPNKDGFASFRISNDISKKMAALIGITNEYKRKGFSILNTIEARYYGGIFNQGNYDYKLRYREPARDVYEMYGNTVGKFLYPLRKFDTPFSQWAVYTEYEGDNVFSINFRGKLQQTFNKKIDANLDYDLNYIAAERNLKFPFSTQSEPSLFFYPFFTAGIFYKIIDEVSTGLILSNKSMNLDLPYPTHYLLSKPRFGISLIANIN